MVNSLNFLVGQLLDLSWPKRGSSKQMTLTIEGPRVMGPIVRHKVAVSESKTRELISRGFNLGDTLVAETSELSLVSPLREESPYFFSKLSETGILEKMVQRPPLSLHYISGFFLGTEEEEGKVFLNLSQKKGDGLLIFKFFMPKKLKVRYSESLYKLGSEILMSGLNLIPHSQKNLIIGCGIDISPIGTKATKLLMGYRPSSAMVH
jgi:hypothetical protein